MSGNPFLTVSQEDTAAFSDQFSNDLTRTEERYLKGFSGNDPEVIEENKTQAAADDFVAEKRTDLDETLSGGVATESEEPINPFLGEVVQAAEQAEEEVAEDIESNPFIAQPEAAVANSVDVPPDVTPEVGSDVKTGVDSLEEIISDLEEAMDATALNARNTEFRVDVELDEPSKELLQQDITAVVAQDPQTFESLEGIVLCGEVSVPKILTILKEKRDSLRSE